MIYNTTIQSSIRPPDRLLPSYRKTRPLNIIGQCCDDVAVLPRGLERLVWPVVEVGRLERTTVAKWRGRRRRRQVGAVRRGLRGVREGRQVVHSGIWSEGGRQRGHLAQERRLVGPQRGGKRSTIWRDQHQQIVHTNISNI